MPLMSGGNRCVCVCVVAVGPGGAENTPFIPIRLVNAKWKATEGYRYTCGAPDTAVYSANI